MKPYTDWTSGEPIEKEWDMTGPTDPALRALVPYVWDHGHGDCDLVICRTDALAAAAEAAPLDANGDRPLGYYEAEAAPLDVTSLAVAILNVMGSSPDDTEHAGVLIARYVAEAIAREYAALRPPDTETAGDGLG